MNATIRTSVGIVVLVIGLGSAWADDAHHPEKADTPMKTSTAKAEGAALPSMPMMQEHMLQMQQQMEKIQNSKDPAEKDKLMQEHMLAMLAHMKMMQGMMSSGMMMGGGMPPQMMEQRLKTMEQRLDQMQMMIDKSRQPAEKSTPAEKK